MGGFLFCYQFSRDGGEGFMDEFSGVLFGGAHGTSDWGVSLVLFAEEVDGLDGWPGLLEVELARGWEKRAGIGEFGAFGGTGLPWASLRER